MKPEACCWPCWVDSLVDWAALAVLSRALCAVSLADSVHCSAFSCILPIYKLLHNQIYNLFLIAYLNKKWDERRDVSLTLGLSSLLQIRHDSNNSILYEVLFLFSWIINELQLINWLFIVVMSSVSVLFFHNQDYVLIEKKSGLWILRWLKKGVNSGWEMCGWPSMFFWLFIKKILLCKDK